MDHVTPRKGKTAYDRRDNLVLACPSCNALKADQPFLAFLLGRRSRAASLLRYGEHLSPMLLDLAREIAGPEAAVPRLRAGRLELVERGGWRLRRLVFRSVRLLRLLNRFGRLRDCG